MFYLISIYCNLNLYKHFNLINFDRATLPVPQFSRNDFSVWSILKQCIGKVSLLNNNLPYKCFFNYFMFFILMCVVHGLIEF